MKTRDRVFNKLESLGYTGIDKDLECSLFDYGFIALDMPESKELHLFIKVQDIGMEFASIQAGWFSYQDINTVINESWFDKKSFLSFVGQNENEWLNNSYVCKISDLFSYYGYENFGFSLYGLMPIKSFFKTVLSNN